MPANSIIKIVNTSGTQVIDTWAFALPKPEPKPSGDQESKEEEKGQQAKKLSPTQLKKSGELPSQEDAEKATQEAQAKGNEAGEETKKSSWTSYVPTGYVPSLGLGGKKNDDKSNEKEGGKKNESEQQKNSRTWGQYFTAGKGFSSYIPKQATDTVSQFAAQVRLETLSTHDRLLTCATAPKRHQQILPATTARLLKDTRRSSRCER